MGVIAENGTLIGAALSLIAAFLVDDMRVQGLLLMASFFFCGLYYGWTHGKRKGGE